MLCGKIMKDHKIEIEINPQKFKRIWFIYFILKTSLVPMLVNDRVVLY